MTRVPDRAGMPTLGTHRSAVGEIGGDVLRQLVFDLVLLFGRGKQARNSLNLYQLAQNNTCLFETARGFKLDIPSIGGHRPSVLEQSSEVLRPLLFEMGLLFWKSPHLLSDPPSLNQRDAKWLQQPLLRDARWLVTAS